MGRDGISLWEKVETFSLLDRIKEEKGSQGKKCKGTWKWRGEKCKNSKIYKDIVTFSKCLAQKNYIQYKLIHTDD